MRYDLRYDLIWVQWVLLYLTDSDLLLVLRRLRLALKPGGLMIVKENCMRRSSGQPGWTDQKESLKKIFREIRNL